MMHAHVRHDTGRLTMSMPTTLRVRTRATKLAVLLSTALASSGVTPAPSMSAGSGLRVTSCADDGSPGTLRSVMLSAPPGSVIDLTQLTCSKITLDQGAIDLIDAGVFSATVMGPGADRLTIDGNYIDTVFRASEIEIDGLTLTHGRAHGSGGCVVGYLSVVLRSSRVIECAAYGDNGAAGGGIASNYVISLYSTIVADNMAIAASGRAYGGGAASFYNLVKVVDSTISGNTAIGDPARGGGLYALGRTSITGSTLDNNVADVGGGSYCRRSFFDYADCEVIDSTISGNIAHDSGGGLVVAAYEGAFVTIDNSTIAYNTAQAGHVGGVLLTHTPQPTITLQSSIFANNSAGVTDLAPDLDTDSATFAAVTGGNDLLMTVGRIQPFPAIIGDPLLAPLADNGGPTRTHALLPGSPAINAGNNVANLATDQRGRARVSGAAADIGAYEVQTDAIFANGFD